MKVNCRNNKSNTLLLRVVSEKMRSLIIFLVFLLPVLSCKKEEVGPPACQDLYNALKTGNTEQAGTVISNFIQGLSSREYTRLNIEKLVSRINQQCGTSAELLCFDCIQTLPSQTEIRISWPSVIFPEMKIIDISYNSNNEMIFRNMHN